MSAGVVGGRGAGGSVSTVTGLELDSGYEKLVCYMCFKSANNMLKTENLLESISLEIGF